MQFMKAAKTLASLHICTGSPEPSYLDNVITLPKSRASNLRVIHVSIFEPRHEISNNVVCATSKASDQPAHTRSLIRAFASRLNIL